MHVVLFLFNDNVFAWRYNISIQPSQIWNLLILKDNPPSRNIWNIKLYAITRESPNTSCERNVRHVIHFYYDQYNNSKLIPVLSDQIVYKNIERHRAYHDMFFGIY